MYYYLLWVNTFCAVLMTSMIKPFILLILLLASIDVHCDDLYNIDHATVSIYAVDCNSGKVIFDKNSNLSLTPASCMKIATTAAALHLLGSKHRFETLLEYDGLIDSSKTLQGNVYIRGGGDPCLGSERIDGNLSWQQQIQLWADAIQNLKIQRIEGKVIADATRWEKALAPASWSWEDLGNYYGAGACALSFHENSYSLFFKPGSKVGDDAQIVRTDPPLPMVTLKNEVKTGPVGSGDCACIFGSEFSLNQFIRGTIPAAVNEFAIRGAIPDPAICCAQLLTQELQARGIAIQGQQIDFGQRITFHQTKSPTVAEIVYWTNQKSVNLFAEHLLKTMGELAYNEGTTDLGIRAITDFWKSQGIDLSGFNMVDGSGLSRKNLITTKQLVEILLKMKKSDFFPLFFDSLPQIQGAIRAKGGSMSLIKGYAGYAGNVAFAILINHCSDPKMMHEKINTFLANLATMNH